jgi:hypothetical protein
MPGGRLGPGSRREQGAGLAVNRTKAGVVVDAWFHGSYLFGLLGIWTFSSAGKAGFHTVHFHYHGRNGEAWECMKLLKSFLFLLFQGVLGDF